MEGLTYTDPATGLEFEWHGGAYIQIGHTATKPGGPRNNLGQWSHDAGDFVAIEVINVWGQDDQPTIPRTREAFEQRCREWMADVWPENEENYRDEIKYWGAR